MTQTDYYAILGVSREATPDQIGSAYRKLARKYHPDVSREPDAEQQFKRLGEAYEVLRDPDNRKLYDEYGSMWKAVADGRAAPRPEPGPGDSAPQPEWDPRDGHGFGFDAESFGHAGAMFEELFGGRGFGFSSRMSGGSGRKAAFRGGDVEATLELPVSEAFQGGEREFSLAQPEKGKTRRLKVRIPPCVRPGQRIRLAGLGQQGLGSSAAGDLYLRVRLRSDDKFRVDGSDLHVSLPLAPWEAALGTTATVPTLEGRARVKVPPGSSTGRQIRLRQRGYPMADGSHGDLYAEVRIEIPRTLTPDERALMKKLAEVSSFSPRADN